MRMLSALLALYSCTILNPMGYRVYWAVPTVTVASNGNRTIECPPYPKEHVLLGTFGKDADIRHHQMDEDDKPACYHYDPITPDESS